MQSLTVAVTAPHPTQYSQPNLVGHDQNIGFLAAFFVTFVFIGFILGCHLQYRRYKKQRAKREGDILQEIETLERIRKMKTKIDLPISSEREKLIETLERIWKMKP